jgi:hypothetical protein
MPPAEFKPTISASEWPQTHDLDRAATGISSASPIYEVQLANAIYCENHKNQTFSLFGQSAEVFNARTGGTCFNHCILKWLNVNNHLILFIGVDEDSELGIVIRQRLDGVCRGRGEALRTRTYQLCGPPSLLYNGELISIPGVKRPRSSADHSPHLAPWLKKEYRNNFTSPPGHHGRLYGERSFHFYLRRYW